MIIKECPKCSQAGQIRSSAGSGNIYRVWVECPICGTRSQRFIDGSPPNESTQGGKFAILAWNSGYFI